jgi:outer membrane immunogenic protein
MFAPNWSAKLEYMYYNFGTTTIVTAPVAVGSRFNDDEHVLKVGVNYRFNWAGPVAARY